MADIKTTSLHDKIEIVDNYIGNNHDATAFIYFEVNDFVLDTRDYSDSFTHYAISLQNQKTGVGQGNQFTLKIAFHSDFATPNVDINTFEQNLSTLITSCLSLGPESKEALEELKSKNKCKLQYGYLNNDELSTTQYEGLLLKYEVTANKQIVEYTLTGISGEPATIATVNWYPRIKPAKDSISTDTQGNKIAQLTSEEEIVNLDLTNASDKQTYEDIIKELNNTYSGPIQVDPYQALEYFIKDYNYNAKIIAKNSGNNEDNVTLFNLVDETGLSLGSSRKLKPVILSLCRNQAPVDYIEYLISMFTRDDRNYGLIYLKQEYDIVDRFVYEFRQNKTNSNLIDVVIRRITSESENYDYKFEGYTPGNNLLISYDLTYDGTIALTVHDGITSDTSSNNNIYIDSRGQITAKALLTKDMFVAGAIDEVRVKKHNTWLDKMSCANNCTMTTFGLPFEIPTGSIFQVSMAINGVFHHTGGRCFVTGVIDRIEKGMFTTQVTMIRLPGKNVDTGV